jgi:diguanylate cyclase (GGDEF)-like protein
MVGLLVGLPRQLVLVVVNDSLSHQAGDELLRGVRDALRDHLRPYDRITRCGCDEFVCALPGLTLNEVRARIAAINATLAHGTVSASAWRWAKPGETVTDLIGRADGDLHRQRERRNQPGWRQ